MDTTRWAKAANVSKIGEMGREVYAAMQLEQLEKDIVPDTSARVPLSHLETLERTWDAIRRRPAGEMGALTAEREKQSAALVEPMEAALMSQNSLMTRLEARLARLDERAQTVEGQFVRLPRHEAIPLGSHSDLRLALQRALDAFANSFNVEVAAPVDEMKQTWAVECALGAECVGLLEKLARHHDEHASMLNDLCQGGADFDPAVAARSSSAHDLALQELTLTLSTSAEAYEKLVRSARNYCKALRITLCGVPSPIILESPMLSVEGIRLVESHADRTVHGCRSLQMLLETRCVDMKNLPGLVQAKVDALQTLKKMNTQIKLIQLKIVANSNRQHELQQLAQIRSDEEHFDISDDEYQDPDHSVYTEHGIQRKLQALHARLTTKSDKMTQVEDGGLEGQVVKVTSQLRELVPLLPELRFADLENFWPGLPESELVMQTAAYPTPTEALPGTGSSTDACLIKHDGALLGFLSPVKQNAIEIEASLPIEEGTPQGRSHRSPTKTQIAAQRAALAKQRQQLEIELAKLGDSMAANDY